jgi:hypothetical protein
MSRAEIRLREAFERLKVGKVHHVAAGEAISKNNVAREAGLVPSALRSDRFPALCLEIKEWVKQHKDDKKSGRQTQLAERRKKRAIREQMEDMRSQRDIALSRLIHAEAVILQLSEENKRLAARAPQPPTPIRPSDRGTTPRDSRMSDKPD